MLIIARDSTYTDSLRPYRIILDGRNIGSLHDGELKHFDIAPGIHTLQLRIDWARSKAMQFDMTAGQDVYFECISTNNKGNVFMRGLASYYYATLGANQYITLQQRVTMSDSVQRSIAHKADHPNSSQKGITIPKLLLLSLFILGAVTLLSDVVHYENNRITYACIANPKPSDEAFVGGTLAFGRDYYDPEQKFCPDNYHPVLKEGWETVDRYVQYTAYAIFVPIVLCTGLLVLFRYATGTYRINKNI